MSVAIEPSLLSADLGSVMTNVKLHVAHQVPGRVRMKIPSAKGNPELLEEMKQTLSVIPGIEEVIINPATGSLVLHYDTDHHDAFHGHLVHHTDGQHQPPPTNEIDALASKIQQEAEFLAENSHAARVVVDLDRKSTRLNSSHLRRSRMPSSA